MGPDGQVGNLPYLNLTNVAKFRHSVNKSVGAGSIKDVPAAVLPCAYWHTRVLGLCDPSGHAPFGGRRSFAESLKKALQENPHLSDLSKEQAGTANRPLRNLLFQQPFLIRVSFTEF